MLNNIELEVVLMYFYYDVSRLRNMELSMYEYGSERCKPGKSFGPWQRYYYMMHYIHSGKGIFKYNNKIYHIEGGQAFVIYPDVVTYYEADFEEPWFYTWIGFVGIKAEAYLTQANLSRDNPVITISDVEQLRSTLQQMEAVNTSKPGSELRLLSLLYNFLAQIIEEAGIDCPAVTNIDKGGLYIRKALDFIGSNYSEHIAVSDIAQYVGLNRSYLCILFKNYLNITPKEFIVNYRVGKACELMQNGVLSIGEVGRLVGYEDQLFFSKVFKKVKGISPKEYKRKRSQSNQN